MAVLRLLILVQLLVQNILSFSYELAFSGDYWEQNFSKEKSEFHSQRIHLFSAISLCTGVTSYDAFTSQKLVTAFFSSSSSFFCFLAFILVDVTVGTDPSLPPHSNWLPGSHHCHFLITHNPPWASHRRGLLDHHTLLHKRTQRCT